MKGRNGHILFFLFVILIFATGYFYFFQISPAFVNKPDLAKPAENTTSVNFGAASYFLNEIGAYKLHSMPFLGEKPVIEVYAEDTGEDIFSEANSGNIYQSESRAPDIKISAKQEVFLNLLNGNVSDITGQVLEGKIHFIVYSDEKTLALKGYKAVFDTLNNEEPIGNTDNQVNKLNPVNLIRGIEIFLFISFALTVAMILEKEL